MKAELIKYSSDGNIEKTALKLPIDISTSILQVNITGVPLCIYPAYGNITSKSERYNEMQSFRRIHNAICGLAGRIGYYSSGSGWMLNSYYNGIRGPWNLGYIVNIDNLTLIIEIHERFSTWLVETGRFNKEWAEHRHNYRYSYISRSRNKSFYIPCNTLYPSIHAISSEDILEFMHEVNNGRY